MYALLVRSLKQWQTYNKAALSRYDSAMTTRRVKLVHTSDVHLDGRIRSDVDGFRNAAERAFARVIDVALAEEADLLLIVGDLFDHARVPEEDFDFVREQLARLACPVVLLPGNHDVHDDRSVWHRIEFDMDGGHNSGHIHLLLETEGDCLAFEDIGVRIWGRAMREHAPENVPLDGVPPRHRHMWNVGLAHGQVVEQRIGMASSQITHEEIRESGFDYLALGHVHVWRDHSQGSTKAYYPGSPVAAYANQDGGHVAIATLCPEDGVNVVRHQVDQREVSTGRAADGWLVP